MCGLVLGFTDIGKMRQEGFGKPQGNRPERNRGALPVRHQLHQQTYGMDAPNVEPTTRDVKQGSTCVPHRHALRTIQSSVAWWSQGESFSEWGPKVKAQKWKAHIAKMMNCMILCVVQRAPLNPNLGLFCHSIDAWVVADVEVDVC